MKFPAGNKINTLRHDLSNGILNGTPKIQEIKAKTSGRDYFRCKSFCKVNDQHN
jgi:hypothetical protein